MRASRLRRARRPLCALVALATLAGPAQAAPAVKLSVALTPEQLGAGTTIQFAFNIAAHDNDIPPPVSAIDLRYPANIGLITSGLGLETCNPAALEALGPPGCPADSLMGYGSALVEMPFGETIIEESAHITTWMAPIQHGHLSLLFYAEGYTPVSSELTLTSLVLEASPPYGGRLYTSIPEIQSLPGAPPASLVHLQSTLGPKNITYYEHYHGKTLAYKPIGLRLPHSCPHGGFPFSAAFAFLNGEDAVAHKAVPCPA